MSANSHVEFIEFVLHVFNNSIQNIVAVIRDNCAVNIAFARKLGCGFIGCESHRFNLAVKSIIAEHRALIDEVFCVIKKFAIECLPQKFVHTRHWQLSAVIRQEGIQWQKC